MPDALWLRKVYAGTWGIRPGSLGLGQGGSGEDCSGALVVLAFFVAVLGMGIGSFEVQPALA